MKTTKEIQTTADGSTTIYLPEIDEHYHSVKGALTESQHIYRDCAFLHRCKDAYVSPVRILEIGFGTGLNATVTAMSTDDTQPVHYVTLEKYPLSNGIISELGYDRIVNSQLYYDIHNAEWGKPIAITPFFTIEKLHTDLLQCNLPDNVDVVYFDAFAPEKQPEMWSDDIFQRIYDVMRDNAILTTYCAKGDVRRMLQRTGFSVERIAGPPGGKREILRATKFNKK